MNPQTMNEQEVRDALAELAGYSFRHNSWWHKNPSYSMCYHPIPATLDEAAKLPEGWHIEMHDNRTIGGKPRFPWAARAYEEGSTANDSLFASGDTERLARFRLRLEVELAEQKGKP